MGAHVNTSGLLLVVYQMVPLILITNMPSALAWLAQLNQFHRLLVAIIFVSLAITTLIIILFYTLPIHYGMVKIVVLLKHLVVLLLVSHGCTETMVLTPLLTIELRVCGDQGPSNEDNPVGFYEIYVKWLICCSIFIFSLLSLVSMCTCVCRQKLLYSNYSAHEGRTWAGPNIFFGIPINTIFFVCTWKISCCLYTLYWKNTLP